MHRDYRSIQRVLVGAFFLNLLAAAPKITIGASTGALSLIADGVDTLFDGLSNVIGLVGVRVSSRPPDEDHPYGHRKFETIAALSIAGALFIAAWQLGSGALRRLFEPTVIEVNRWSLAALVFGAVVQGATGWWEMSRGRSLQSEVLRADARHTIASLGVSLSVLVGLFFTWLGYERADPIAALIVAIFIAKVGVDTLRENIPTLVDQAPLSQQNIAAVVESVEGVESYHRIRSRGTTDNVAIDLHVRVDPDLSMQDANAIADEVRRRLLSMPGVDDVTVHAEADRDKDIAPDLQAAAKLAAREVGLSLHECWVQAVDGHISMHLHVGVDPALTLKEAHAMVDRLEKLILERQPTVESVYSHIELASPEILPSARVSRPLQQRVTKSIEEAAAGFEGLSNVHNIHVRQVEGRLFVTLEANVDGNLSVTEAHELSTQLQEAIRAYVPNAGEVLVHLEPAKLPVQSASTPLQKN
jgi:cation diffusion facilitator family transporter